MNQCKIPQTTVMFGIVCLLTVVSISFSPQCMAVAAEKEPVKIGVIGGLTGMMYLTMKPYVDGVTLAVKELNASGGILGRPIETFVRDDEIKVDVGVREMKDLILRKKVDVVMGGIASHLILAQSEVAKQYKTPYFVGMGNSHRITEEKGHRYVFQNVPNTRMEATAVATYVAKQGWKRIWTLMPDYEWGHTFLGLCLEKLKKLNPEVTIVGESWPKLSETDFTAYISAMQGGKPEFVLGGLAGADLINFTKQAKPYGLTEKFPVSGIYDLNQLRALGQEMVEGAVGYNRGEFFCIDTPEMNAFVDKFRKAFGGEYPTAYSVFGYEAVYLTKQAMEKAKTTNKEKVVDALEGMQFSSPRGNLYIRPYDHMVNGTVYVGYSTKSSKYPFYVYRDVMTVPGEQTWLSVEEIKKIRGAK